MDTEHKLSVKFNNSWLKGVHDLKRRLFWKALINTIKNFFGIYEIWQVKMLSEPKQIGNGKWEYKIKVSKIKKYFLYINYANRDWNSTK